MLPEHIVNSKMGFRHVAPGPGGPAGLCDIGTIFPREPYHPTSRRPQPDGEKGKSGGRNVVFRQVEQLLLKPHCVTKTNPSPLANVTGHRIRQARLACQPVVTQQQLARKLARKGVGLDQTAISRIEQRQRGISDCELAAVASCLKVSIAWLFELE
jgi:hypothetical protein